MNVVILRGLLSRPPARRTLPSGDELVTYEVTVARSEGPDESVPVVWFGAPASAVDLDAGDAVVAVGRVRRRFYRAGGSTQSRTEVVADGVVVDHDLAEAVAERVVAASELATDIVGTPIVRVDGGRVEVEISLRADYIFAGVVPGTPDGMTVTATASARAARP